MPWNLLLAEEASMRHVPHTLLLFELVCSCATATIAAQTQSVSCAVALCPC
jgi:hypothetical protein